ncbi:hypothetical protein G6F54_013677 [Rhizopus delemar]|nr:hypothetical protein G6F54_013677 [Rhizopus delemar]
MLPMRSAPSRAGRARPGPPRPHPSTASSLAWYFPSRPCARTNGLLRLSELRDPVSSHRRSGIPSSSPFSTGARSSCSTGSLTALAGGW